MKTNLRIRRQLPVTLLTSSVIIAASASLHATTDNSYAMIARRNAFGLRPPPLVETRPPEPHAKIRLDGITTILGDKRALLTTTPPARPGTPAKETVFVLKEGEKEGGLKVLAIDENRSLVRVLIDGQELCVSF